MAFKERMQRIKEVFPWVKNHRSIIILFVLILAPVSIIYSNDFVVLANEAVQNEAFSHILILPFFATFLVYLKKKSLSAALAVGSAPKRAGVNYLNVAVGIILCQVALLVYWYGSWDSLYTLEYHIISLPIFLMGLIAFFFNMQVLRALLLPILFLLFMVPPPAVVLYSLGGVLANFNTQITYSVLTAFGIPITLSSNYGAPTLLLTSAGGVPTLFSIDVPCSGVYSLIAFTMFAAFLAFITSSSAIKKFLTFVTGFFVFMALNILRVTLVVSVGYAFGAEPAMILHSFAGLVLIFIGMLLILIASEKMLKMQLITRPVPSQPCIRCQSKTHSAYDFCRSCGRFLGRMHFHISKETYAKALILIVASSAAYVVINSPSFASGQTSVELTNYQNAANLIPEIPNYNLSFIYRDTDYEKVAHQDLSIMYAYYPSNQSNSVIYVDVGVANTQSNLHSWEVCYITYQTAQGHFPLVNEIDSKQIKLQDSTTAEYLSFKNPNGNYTQITLYWFNKAMFRNGFTVEQKYFRISLIILTFNPKQDFPRYEQELVNIANSISTRWAPMKMQAFLSVGIPALQASLAILAVLVIAIVFTQYANGQRKVARNKGIFESFSSHKERLVFQAIKELATEKRYVKTADVTNRLQEKIGKLPNYKLVYKILSSLEENGLIKKKLVIKRNIATQEWSL